MWEQRRPGEETGITLPEILVVVAIISLAVVVSVPMISKAVRSAKIRAESHQFSVTVKAVRMIAVTTQGDAELVIKKKPENYYEYIDNDGRTRRHVMPTGVCISDSDGTLRFSSNGSLEGGTAATTTFEARVGEGHFESYVEKWTVATNLLGISSVSHEIVEEAGDPCAN